LLENPEKRIKRVYDIDISPDVAQCWIILFQPRCDIGERGVPANDDELFNLMLAAWKHELIEKFIRLV
jgi:hypothetical protein